MTTGVKVEGEVCNGAIPGPTLRLNVGDTVIVRLVNDLPYPTGIHWHGIELHNSADGTPVTQDAPGRNVLDIDCEIFRGTVADDLAIEIDGGEADWFTRNDPLGTYTRHFHGSPAKWLGHYRPDDEPVDEEDVGLWRVTYRIERA